MDLFKNIVDELYEMIYIADIETYELLYINNAARKSLKLPNKDYTGCKCYEVLQQKNAPCSFCTNAKLTDNNYYVWEHDNPVSNCHYILKDKIINYQGRLARLEVAIDLTEQNKRAKETEDLLKTEYVVLDCLKLLHSNLSFEDMTLAMFKKIGEFLEADRVANFEIVDGKAINSTTWKQENVKSYQTIIPGPTLEDVTSFFAKMGGNACYTIEDIETIKEHSPNSYMRFKADGIKSIVVLPINYKGKILGYLRVENPKVIQRTEVLLSALSYFMIYALDRHINERKLHYLSFYDALTGVRNHNSYFDLIKKFDQDEGYQNVGIVFSDINCLKKINDAKGHLAGDEFLITVAKKFIDVFGKEIVYRIGGDEFVIICIGVEKEKFHEKVVALNQKLLDNDGYLAAVGCVYKEHCNNLEEAVSEADRLMYRNKRLNNNTI